MVRISKPLRSASREPMLVATYNVNGVHGRLPVLLRWLEERSPTCRRSDARDPAAEQTDAALDAGTGSHAKKGSVRADWAIGPVDH